MSEDSMLHIKCALINEWLITVQNWFEKQKLNNLKVGRSLIKLLAVHWRETTAVESETQLWTPSLFCPQRFTCIIHKPWGHFCKSLTFKHWIKVENLLKKSKISQTPSYLDRIISALSVTKQNLFLQRQTLVKRELTGANITIHI